MEVFTRLAEHDAELADRDPVEHRLAIAGRALRNAGYDVVVASDGPEALRLVDARRRSFDLWVLGLLMPQMRGDELSRSLRQSDPE